jgi:WD40 repeat protein
VLADWLRLWDVERNQLINDIGTGSSWSPDGGMIVVGGESVINIWDAHSGSRLHLREGYTGAGVSSLDWVPNEGVIASLSASDQAILWNASTGARIRTLDIAQEVQDMAVSPDGRLLAVHGDTFVTVWDVQTGMLLYRLKGIEPTKGRFRVWFYYIEGTPSVAWSPDGTKLAAAWRKIWIGGPSTIHVWDATTGQLLHEFEGHTADVPALAFSPDGTRLASGSMDGMVIVWDVSE